MLIPGDLERILKHQQVAAADQAAWTDQHFCRSDGVKVLTRDGLMQIPTITPRLTDQGCVFWDKGRCRIHAVSPYGCSHYDSHMGRDEGDQVTRHGLVAIRHGAEAYYATWNQLTTQAQPLAERRARYNEIHRQLESPCSSESPST
jgi:Fe-S-cluster containining protein